jgi:hypothetical protein
MFFGERQRLELHCRSNRLFGLIGESEAARALCYTHRDNATGFTGRVSSYRNCPHSTIVPMLEVHGSLCNDHLYMYQIFQSRLQAEVRLKASRTIHVVRTQAGCTCCISNVLSHTNDNVDWWNTTIARRCILVVCIDPAAAGSRKPSARQSGACRRLASASANGDNTSTPSTSDFSLDAHSDTHIVMKTRIPTVHTMYSHEHLPA